MKAQVLKCILDTSQVTCNKRVLIPFINKKEVVDFIPICIDYGVVSPCLINNNCDYSKAFTVELENGVIQE